MSTLADYQFKIKGRGDASRLYMGKGFPMVRLVPAVTCNRAPLTKKPNLFPLHRRIV
jgi:hypothetical protein